MTLLALSIKIKPDQLCRVVSERPYSRYMGVARRGNKVNPVPRDEALDAYAGEWVALKDGVVIAHGPSSRDVVRQLKNMGPAGKGAVLHRAATRDEPLSVGLG